MGLAKDLSSLPTPARTTDDGCPPDAQPWFIAPYFDHLRQLDAEEGERPHAVEGTRFRHSMAGACARQVAYHALGVAASDPMDLAGIVVTRNGTAKHDEIQAVLLDHYGPSLDIEVGCQVARLDGSGNADGLLLDARMAGWCQTCGHAADRHAEGPCAGQERVGPGNEHDGGDFAPCSCTALAPNPPQRVCWEHKNVGGFAYKMAVGERGKPQGPKHEHRVQAALNAKALDADLVVITYATWEAISVGTAARKGFTEEARVVAQWTFTRDEWEPLADAEIERVNAILGLLDDGMLPARKIPSSELPKRHVITDPTAGAWQEHGDDGQVLDAGTYWACGYCRWQTLCAGTAAGRQPIAEVAVHLGLTGEAA